MAKKILKMNRQKKIALIAHDNRKADLLEWAKFNRDLLSKHKLFGTGTTGGLVSQELNVDVHRLKADHLAATSRLELKFLKGTSIF